MAKKKRGAKARAGTSAVTPALQTISPTTADLEQAKEDALLQLRIGRSAHYYTVIVAAALLLDGFLVLLVPGSILSSTPFVGNLWFLLPPVVAGVYLAVFGLSVKWEDYQYWPWESHFSTTVAGVALSFLTAFLYFARVFHFGPTGGLALLPWFYPMVLTSIALPLAGLSLTWPGWSRNKSGGFVAAILPVPIAFALYYPAIGTAAVNELAVTLFAGAVLFQMSGSFLHLISSGTDVTEREVISSGQNRMVQLANELDQRQEALRFRELSLGGREADLETSEGTLRRSAEALEDQRQHLAGLEADLGQRSNEVTQREHALEARMAESNAVQVTLDNRRAELELREQDVGTRLPRVVDREKRIASKESELSVRETTIGQRQQDFGRRESQLKELDQRLQARQSELDRKTNELLQKESELRTLSSAKGLPPIRPGSADAARIRDVEQREAALARLKLVLDEQNATLGRKSKELEKLVLESQRSAGEVARREEALASRQASVERQESDLRERATVGSMTREKFETALRGFEEKAKDLERREAELRMRSSEIGRLSMAAEKKEALVKTLEAKVAADRLSLERLESKVRERERSADSRAAEIGVRAASAGGAKAVAEPAPITLTTTDESLLKTPTTKLADRLPTGTPRLDDLVLGGIPPRGHVLLVGPPFSGKETLLYAFIAEGLRRGEPGVLVTASQSPEEIEQKVGVILPQFKEFLQRGRVIWIDASNPAPVPGSGGRDGSQVKGPSDHSGILSAIVAGANRVANGGKTLRVGFLGLSASLAHSDERAGYVFIQNLVGILKGRNAVAMYSVDKGALSEAQIQAIQGRVDGSIEFKAERGKNFLSVQGLGDVQSRDWIEYRATARGLVIGSFSLERIR